MVILTALRNPIVRLITTGLSGDTEVAARAKILLAHREILKAIRSRDAAAADRRSPTVISSICTPHWSRPRSSSAGVAARLTGNGLTADQVHSVTQTPFSCQIFRPRGTSRTTRCFHIPGSCGPWSLVEGHSIRSFALIPGRANNSHSRSDYTGLITADRLMLRFPTRFPHRREFGAFLWLNGAQVGFEAAAVNSLLNGHHLRPVNYGISRSRFFVAIGNSSLDRVTNVSWSRDVSTPPLGSKKTKPDPGEAPRSGIPRPRSLAARLHRFIIEPAQQPQRRIHQQFARAFAARTDRTS